MDGHAGAGARAVVALGLMSGTSLDGVDAALAETDGEDSFRPLAALTLPYPETLRARLVGAPPPPDAVRALTDHHADAARRLLAEAGVEPAAVRVAGFPGQTVAHAPEEGWTWQAGDARRLADALGIDVVTDFRSRDMAHGGEGAPLVPLFHRAVAPPTPRPLAVLNLGGVANVTWLGEDGRTLAFDTGPGNAPLDDLARRVAGEPFDRDGRLAAAGTPDRAALARLLADPWFDRPPPKSLDRHRFDAACAEAAGALEPADAAATLTAFVAAAVARGAEHFPAPAAGWVVAGGGRRNPAVTAALAEALGLPVRTAEAAGLDGDALEAQAFAWLAVRSLRALPLTLPETTGVARPVSGGVLVRAGAASGAQASTA